MAFQPQWFLRLCLKYNTRVRDVVISKHNPAAYVAVFCDKTPRSPQCGHLETRGVVSYSVVGA